MVPPARLPLSHHPRLYQPRQARHSPLYRVVEDHLETFLADSSEGSEVRPAAYAEDSLRRFLNALPSDCGRRSSSGS